jgi:hypothetical protein
MKKENKNTEDIKLTARVVDPQELLRYAVKGKNCGAFVSLYEGASKPDGKASASMLYAAIIFP